MIARSASRLVVPALALVLLVALTGCSKPGGQPGVGSIGSIPASSQTPSTPAADGARTDSSADAATLDGISRDLDSVDAANGEAGSNAAAGDQAGATGDEP